MAGPFFRSVGSLSLMRQVGTKQSLKTPLSQLLAARIVAGFSETSTTASTSTGLSGQSEHSHSAKTEPQFIRWLLSWHSDSVRNFNHQDNSRTTSWSSDSKRYQAGSAFSRQKPKPCPPVSTARQERSLFRLFRRARPLGSINAVLLAQTLTFEH